MANELPILEELDARGLIQDVSGRDELANKLANEVVRFYIGYDPTGTSLHIGNLQQVLMQVRLQRAGHKPYVLVGGATGMIGDPSGKSSERSLLDADALAANVDAIRNQLSRFIDFSDSPTGAVMVNNHDWFKGLGYIEFLRDVGKLLTVNYMTAKESVRARLEDRDQGISYTEFSYMLLQAYDFVELARAHGCALQMGGSDQWGNITAGIELQRKMGRPTIYGLTSPLLLDSDGKKMGKTATGQTVWLDADRSSPYSMYQYWLNVADADVERLLLRLTLRPVDEIRSLAAEHAEAPHKRLGQKALAEDVTAFVHGDDAVRRAVAASQVMFGGSLEELGDADLEPLLADVPSSEMARTELEDGVGLVELLAKVGLAKSKGEARRLLKNGGAYVNNVRESDVERTVTVADLGTETMLVLRAGRKNYHIVRIG